MHIHSARRIFGWVLGVTTILTPVALAVPMALSPSRAPIAPVTGQVNLDGHPVGNLLICFDSGDEHFAEGWVETDGSFHLHSRGRGRGIIPGTYHVHLLGAPGAVPFPSKYRSAGTSGLKVEVTPDWNDFSFNLH
jgi:hypothetical protein